MNTSDNFCLKWKDFRTVVTYFLANLVDFSDVTFACEDGQFEAHRFVLATCSPFFKTVLNLNTHGSTLKVSREDFSNSF